jgi:hypothetical protein
MAGRSCAFCGWIPPAGGWYLRLGDDRKLSQVGGELICSLCATPADTGSKRYARERD